MSRMPKDFEEDSPLVQLANKRIIMLSGDIEESPITIVIAHLFNLEKEDSTKPIRLVINTEGGSVDDMLALYDVIQWLPCPVHTLGLGKIMSAGIFLLAAGEPGYREIGKNARCMFHMLYGSSEGTILDYNNEVAEHQRIQTQINKIFSKHTKIKTKELKRWMNLKTDIYISAAEAINYGIADNYFTKF